MPGDLHIPVSTIIAFVLVLARMSGVFAFVPLPFKDSGPTISRVVLALGATLALYSRWPAVNIQTFTLPLALGLMLSELALGASVGLLVSFLAEAFAVGAQSLALQAGYAYASIIDPSTQADSDVLVVLSQLLAGLFFFTANLHLWVIRVFAESLDRYPPGAFMVTPDIAQNIIQIGAGIFSIGLRLSLPIVILLLLTELTLALVGRINSQLQMSTHSFPIKMLLTLATLGAVLIVTPHLFSAYADEIMRSVTRGFLR